MDKKAVDFFQEAIKEYEAKNPQEALAYFYLALREIDPQMEQDLEKNILINIAQIYDEEGEKDKALALYKIMALRYNSPEAFYGQGMLEEELGNTQKAFEFYQKALERDPNYRDALFFLANLYDVNGQTKEAIETYEDLLKKHPKDYMTWNNLGSIYEERGDYQKAKDYFQKSIRWNEDYFRSHFNLGIVYKKLGERDQALEEYLLAKNLEKDPNIYLNISALFIEEKDYESANKYLSEGIYYQESEANLYYNRACTFVHLGKKTQAVEDAVRSLELNPDLLGFMREDADLKPILAEVLEKNNN